MAAQRHEISLRVLKNISRVSPPFELFYDEFKVPNCCTKTFYVGMNFRKRTAFFSVQIVYIVILSLNTLNTFKNSF